MDDANYTTLDNELPVFIVKQAITLTDRENSKFALEPDFGVLLNHLTQTDGTNPTVVSLAEFTKAQTADDFHQNAAEELGKVKTEKTTKK